MQQDFTTEDVLNAYRCGLFPMADSRSSGQFYWYDPPVRGQLPIEALHIPDRLRRTVLRAPYEIRVDTDFEQVIDSCAAAAPDRPQTWINGGIRDLFVTLHHEGHTHSIEAWHKGELAGGLYGLALGGAFMGESMFSRMRDASKICLVHLCARLWKGGFTVLDTQFLNEHLLQFGAYEIPREDYLARLALASAVKGDFRLKGATEGQLVRSYLESRNASPEG